MSHDGATKAGGFFDFHEARFVEEHQPLVHELAQRMGAMVAAGDKRSLTLMATALQNLCELAFREYQARHGQAEELKN